mmetsp:Transcript_6671/g.11812  ORF Transcript_6671/g.11812 Transcript_6671/m.11812 type:complete len:277 (-) Transcript_6671:37-867(-)
MLRSARTLRLFSTSTADYYEILGLKQTATFDQVKQAYRKLAKQYHPDVAGNEGAEERFRQIAEAFRVLSKKDSRVLYDLNKTSASDVEKILSKKRDNSGLDISPIDFAAHSEGYKRLQELAEERKMHNLDKFYRYKGGVPKKGFDAYRGESKGFTGSRAYVPDLNYNERGHNLISPSEDTVTKLEANAFKTRVRDDSFVHLRRRPYMPAQIDYNFTSFTLLKTYLAFTGFFGFLLTAKYLIDEPPKLLNRLKLQELVNAGSTGLPEAGMRAISWRS